MAEKWDSSILNWAERNKEAKEELGKWAAFFENYWFSINRDWALSWTFVLFFPLLLMEILLLKHSMLCLRTSSVNSQIFIKVITLFQ